MKDKQFAKELGSYVSAALSMKPDLSLSKFFVDSIGTITEKPVGTQDTEHPRLSGKDLEPVESLFEKFMLLKKYLPAASLDNAEILDSAAAEHAEASLAGTGRQAVAVNRSQVDIARFVSKKVEAVHDAIARGDYRQATANYVALNEFLANKRTELMGKYKSVAELEESFGMHAVGANGNPQAMAGMVIFIIIEIFIG